MLLDFLLYVIIGPLVGYFIYHLTEDRKRSEEYLEQVQNESHLVY